MTFINKHRTRRPGQTREDVAEECKALAEQFYSRDAADRLVFTAKEQENAAHKFEEAYAPDPDVQYETAIGDKLWGKSHRAQPLLQCYISEMINKEVPLGAGHGMHNYADRLRVKFGDGILYGDDGDDGIDCKEKLEQHTPCGVLHPGLCPAKMPDKYDAGVQIMSNLEALIINSNSIGSVYILRGQPSDVTVYVRASYIRRGQGVVVSFHELVHEGAQLCL